MPISNQLTSPLGPRFHFVNVLPASLLVGVILLITGSGGLTGTGPSLNRLSRSAGDFGLVNASLVALAIALLSVLANSFQGQLTKLLEGYWKPCMVGRALLRYGYRRHAALRNRYRNLLLEPLEDTPGAEDQIYDDIDAAPLCSPFGRVELDTAESEYVERAREAWVEDRLAVYPPLPEEGKADRLMPTRLGNALRRSEDLAGDRYGIDAIVAVPYLLAVASAAVVSMVEDARQELDALVQFVAVCLLSSVLCAVSYHDDGPWFTISISLFLLACAFYSASVRAAIDYGERLIELVDLHRFDLLQALHMKLPAAEGFERDTHGSAWRIIREGPSAESGVAYEHPGDGHPDPGK